MRKPNVNDEVIRLQQRLGDLEFIQVLLHRTQVDSLKQAEKLRRLARAAVRNPITVSAIDRLEAFVRDLKPFWKNPGPMPPALKRLLAQHRKAGR